MKIKSDGKYLVHGIAQCADCDFGDAIINGSKKEYSRLKRFTHKHIRETGHTVMIETGYSQIYKIDNGK